jgi:hypothetical protein
MAFAVGAMAAPQGVSAAVGAVSSIVSALDPNAAKEGQREAYLNTQAAQAQSGNAGALKLIYDWANGISATECDGTNRGDEPSASKQYAQQILLNLQRFGITYSPTTGAMGLPGTTASGFLAIGNLFQGGSNASTLILELGVVVVAAILIAMVVGKK